MLKIIIFVGALLVEEEIYPETEDYPKRTVQTCEDSSLSSNINNECIFDSVAYLEFDDSDYLVPPYVDEEKR